MKPLLLPLLCLSLFGADEAQLRKTLEAKTGAVTLPSGTIEIAREIVLPPDAHDLDIGGSNTTLKAAATFRGRALLVFPAGRNIHLHDLELDGSRDTIGRMTPLPANGILFSRSVANNGILAEGIAGFEASQIKAAHIAGFAFLIAAGRNIKLHDIEITESGGYNLQHRNNGSGGILLEDGVTDFEIRRNQLGGIRGNAVAIHSSNRGRISENEFAILARAAIQVSQATALTIENNRARQIGAPTEEVESRAECMRLEKLTDSTVSSNTCEETLLGAIVLSGSGNKITANRLLRLNLARKDEAGILLESPAASNTIDANEISGPGMSAHCIGTAPGVAKNANKILKNDCSDEASVARLQPVTPR